MGLFDKPEIILYIGRRGQKGELKDKFLGLKNAEVFGRRNDIPITSMLSNLLTNELKVCNMGGAIEMFDVEPREAMKPRKLKKMVRDAEEEISKKDEAEGLERSKKDVKEAVNNAVEGAVDTGTYCLEVTIKKIPPENLETEYCTVTDAEEYYERVEEEIRNLATSKKLAVSEDLDDVKEEINDNIETAISELVKGGDTAMASA